MIRAFALLSALGAQVFITFGLLWGIWWWVLLGIGFGWQFVYWGATLNRQERLRKAGVA